MTPMAQLVRKGFDLSPLHGGKMGKGPFPSWSPDPHKHQKLFERSPSDRATIKMWNNLVYSGANVVESTVFAPFLPHCDKPVRVYRVADACQKTKEHSKAVVMFVPCRKCLKCGKVKASLWVDRAKKELALWAGRTWSVTLTFSQVHLGIVRKKAQTFNGTPAQRMERAGFYEVQKYFKKLRKAADLDLRYLAVAEYGENNGRLHYHVFIHEVQGKVFKKTLEKRWASIVHARLVANSVKQAEYLCKYVTKTPGSRIRASRFYGNKEGKAVMSVARKVSAFLASFSSPRQPMESSPTFSKNVLTLGGTSLLPIHKSGENRHGSQLALMENNSTSSNNTNGVRPTAEQERPRREAQALAIRDAFEQIKALGISAVVKKTGFPTQHDRQQAGPENNSVIHAEDAFGHRARLCARQRQY